MSNLFPSEQQTRRDALYCLRRLAREIAEHARDPAELGLDLEEMQGKATDDPDPFVRAVAVRYLQRRQFGSSRDPRRAAA